MIYKTPVKLRADQMMVFQCVSTPANEKTNYPELASLHQSFYVLRFANRPTGVEINALATHYNHEVLIVASASSLSRLDDMVAAGIRDPQNPNQFIHQR